MGSWPAAEIRAVRLESFDERYRRYRLVDATAERGLRRSLERYGQLSPVVVCVQDGQCVLIDGFKRLQAARTLKGTETLAARCLELDAQAAKAAIYTLNRLSRPPQELEEAWIVHALVREDGLAALLDRLAKMHSWLRYSGRGELQACDRELIRPGFERLLAETAVVREATQDFVAELQQP